MSGYSGSLSRAVQSNQAFRRVLATGQKLQLALMTLQKGEEIGVEKHPHTDQFIVVESGTGYAVVGGVKRPLQRGSAVLIPSGTRHNVVNTGSGPLRLYTLYAPPEHSSHLVTLKKPK